jgi:DNA replication protein DnaC
MILEQNHLRYMNIGAKYEKAEQEDLTKNQKNLVGKYIERLDVAIREGVGLFLTGPNGTGKSHVSAILCKIVRSKYRISSYFVTAAELKSAWISNIPAHEGSEEFMADRVNTAKFLVIDDLGKEYRTSSGFSESNFESLIRTRVRKKYITVITTNLSADDFRNVYGVGTSELVKESTIKIDFVGENMRDKKAKEIASLFK